MIRKRSHTPDGPRRRPDSIVKNTVTTFVAQMTTASLTAVMTLFLVRGLGVREYGIFALAVGMSTIAIALSDLGISDSTARFVAERRDRDDGTLAALVNDALKLKLVATGTLCALFAAAAPLIADIYGTPALVWPVRGIALATFGQSTYAMVIGVSTALGRSAVNVRLVASESVLELVASVGLVLLGAGAAGAAFGRAVGFCLGALIAAVVVLRLSGHGRAGFWHRPQRKTIRLVSGYAGPVFAIDASYTLSSTLCVLLVGVFAGSAASGEFQAPWKLITLIQYVGLATAYGIAPRLARGGGQQPNTAALNRALRGLIAFQCLALAPAVVWAHPITHLLLGAGYGSSSKVLATLAPYIFFSGLSPLVTSGVSYVGEAKKRVPVALATLALVVVCGAILIPRDGVVGAAIATDIAFGFYTLAHIWLCRKLLELRIVMLLWSLACGLTAAGAMGLVLAAIGTRHLTILSWLEGGCGGLAAYAAMLLFTREIRGEDVVHGWQAVGRRLRRGADAPTAVEAMPVEAMPVEAMPVEAMPVEAMPVEPTRKTTRSKARREARAEARARAREQVRGAAQEPATSEATIQEPRVQRRSPASEPPPWLAETLSRRDEPAPRRRRRGRRTVHDGADGSAPRSPDLVYGIAWRLIDDREGVFELRPIDDVAGSAPASPREQSPPVAWAWRIGPAPTSEACRAQSAFVERLLASGWRPAGAGEPWFEDRFRAPMPSRDGTDDREAVSTGAPRTEPNR